MRSNPLKVTVIYFKHLFESLSREKKVRQGTKKYAPGREKGPHDAKSAKEIKRVRYGATKYDKE